MITQLNELDHHNEMMIKINEWKKTWDGKFENIPEWVHEYGLKCLNKWECSMNKWEETIRNLQSE